MMGFKEFLREGLMGAVEPLIGEAGKKKKKRKEGGTGGGPDVPIQLNKGVPNRFQNIGRDTGQSI